MKPQKDCNTPHHETEIQSFASDVFSSMRAFSGSWENGSSYEKQREALEMLARNLSNTINYAEEAGVFLTFGRPVLQYRVKNDAEWRDSLEGGDSQILSDPNNFEVRTIYVPVDPRGSTAPPRKASAQGCSKCGSVGIHACLGYPIPEWTPEKIAEFNEVLSQYETEPTTALPENRERAEVESFADMIEERQALWSLVRRATPLQSIRRILREKGISNETLLDRLKLARPEFTLDSLTEILRGGTNICIDDLYVLADALDVVLRIEYTENMESPA